MQNLSEPAQTPDNPTTAPSVMEVRAENAQQVLIEGSMEKPVLAIFWMASEPSSITLRDQLAEKATKANGQWSLATLDVEVLMPIAQQLGVQQVPTVMVLKQGQPVDGFVGQQDDEKLAAFMEKHVPPAWMAEFDALKAQLAEGHASDVLPALRQIHQEANGVAVVSLTLADALLQLKRDDEAAALLDTITMVDQDAYFEQLKATLELQKNAADSAEIQALEAALEQSPDDLSLKMQLSIQYFEEKQCEKALEHLIEILRVDLNFGDGQAKKTFLDIVAALGKGDPTAIRFQRQFFTLLY